MKKKSSEQQHLRRLKKFEQIETINNDILNGPYIIHHLLEQVN